MANDEFGFPRRVDFDDNPETDGPRITPGRIFVLLGIVLFAALIAGGVQIAHELNNDEPGFFKDLSRKINAMFADRPHAVVDRLQRNLRQKNYKEALADADRLIEVAPQAGRMLRADILGRMQRYDESIAEYTRVLEDDPFQPTAYNNRAYNRALARVDLDKALDDVDEALKLAGDVPAFIDTRAYIFYLMDRQKDALADLNSVLDAPRQFHRMDSDGLGEIYFHRALVHQQLGADDLAKKDFERAQQLGFEVPDELPLPMEK